MITNEMKANEDRDKPYFVKCDACGVVFENWPGSTPCCGSLASECDKWGEIAIPNNKNQ